MNVLALPAVLAILINIAVIWFSSKGRTQTRGFIPLVLSYSAMNFFEIAARYKGLDEAQLELIVRCYYCAALLSLAMLSLYSCEVAHLRNRAVTMAILSAASLISLALLFSDYIVSGTYSIGYTVTAIQGSAYILFRLFSLCILASSAAVLIIGYVRAKNHEQQIRCASTIMALSPSFIVSIVLVFLMWLGVSINAAVVLPFTMIAFILITLASEERHQLTDIRRFIPGSPERRSSKNVMEICTQYARDEISYRDAISDIERVLVMHKYQKNDKNASATAELMGMPRSSLYSIFNRLKIESKNQ